MYLKTVKHQMQLVSSATNSQRGICNEHGFTAKEDDSNRTPTSADML
jgi:hypothetical protein